MTTTHTISSVAAHVVTLTSDPDCDMDALSRVILADAPLSLRFLALANSAAFSRGQEIRDLRGSLVRLGMNRVRDLALLMGAHDMFPATTNVKGLPSAAVWQHNLATACWARLLGRDLNEHAQDAWLAGILQGIGLGVLMQRAPREMEAAVALARTGNIALADACRLSCGCDPWQVGAAVCQRWNLPRLLCDVVAHQGDRYPSDHPPAEAEPLIRAVQRARELATSQGLGVSGEGLEPRALAEAGAQAGVSAERLDEFVDEIATEVAGLAGSLMSNAPSTDKTVVDARSPLARLGLAGVDAALVQQDLQQQLDTAREIQQRLLPVDWSLPGPWTVAAVNRPSRTVSGDIYDILPAAAGRTAIVVADVCGKGVAAALLASNLQATVRALAPVIQDPAELLAQVNRQLCQATDDEKFATMFMLLLPDCAGPVHYVSAGHVPPLVLRVTGTLVRLRPGGPPVGMLPDASYEAQELALDPGDQVIVCTDGLTEAADSEGKQFGEDGLAMSAGSTSDTDPSATMDRVLEAVLAHSGPLPGPADDLTLLVVGRNPDFTSS